MSGASYRTLCLPQDVRQWDQRKIIARNVWEALRQGDALNISLAIDSSGKRHLVLNAEEAGRLENVQVHRPRRATFSIVSPVTFTKLEEIEKWLQMRENRVVDREVMFESLRLLCHLSCFPDDAKYYCMTIPSDPVQVLALCVRHWQEDSDIRLGFQISVGTFGCGPGETLNFRNREYAALDTPNDDPCRLRTGDMLSGLKTLQEKLNSGRPTLLVVLDKDDQVMRLLAEAKIDTTSSLECICRPTPPREPARPSRNGRDDSYRPPRERDPWSGDRDGRASTSMKGEPGDDFRTFAERRNDARSLSPRRRSPRHRRARSRHHSSSEPEEHNHKLPPAPLPVLLSLSEIYGLARNDMTASPGLATIAGPSCNNTCNRHCSDSIYKLFASLIKGPASYQVATGTLPQQDMSSPGNTPTPASTATAAAPTPIFDEDDTEPQMPLPACATAGVPTSERLDYDILDDDFDFDDGGYHYGSLRPTVSANSYENEDWQNRGIR